MLSLLFALIITKNLLFGFEKSFKYIEDFLRGKSPLRGPGGKLKKRFLRLHLGGQKWHLRKRNINLADFCPFLGPKHLKMAIFTLPSVYLVFGAGQGVLSSFYPQFFLGYHYMDPRQLLLGVFVFELQLKTR